MADIQRNISLRKIIIAYIDEAKQTIGEYARLRGIAFRGLVDIGFDVTWAAKCIELEVSPNNTAELPGDYLQWVRIGNFNSKGEIATLRVNTKISNYKAASVDRLSDLSPIISDYSGQQIKQGVNINYKGECKVDELNSLILLNPDYQFNSVVLQYISSPEQDDDYTVPLQIYEALISWIRWKDVISLRSVGLGEKESRRQNFIRDKHLAAQRIKPFRLQEALEALYSNGWSEKPFGDSCIYPTYGMQKPQQVLSPTDTQIFDNTFDNTFE